MFDFLPKVNDCCCGCSLKTGSILIGICGIVSLGGSSSVYTVAVCSKGSGVLGEINQFFMLIALLVDVLLELFSIIFLISFCRKSCVIGATLMLIAIFMFLLMNLVRLILIAASSISISSCRERLYVHGDIFLIPLWIYFMIVVRSYRDQMVSQGVESGQSNPNSTS